MNRSIRACGATRLQCPLDIPSHVQNFVDLGIHCGTTISLVVAQFCTRLTSVPWRGASSVVFENLIQGYDEAACEVVIAGLVEDLIWWAP